MLEAHGAPFLLTHKLIEHLFAGVVLTESVVAEWHRVTGDVGVEPVQHRRFDTGLVNLGMVGDEVVDLGRPGRE